MIFRGKKTDRGKKNRKNPENRSWFFFSGSRKKKLFFFLQEVGRYCYVPPWKNKNQLPLNERYFRKVIKIFG